MLDVEKRLGGGGVLEQEVEDAATRDSYLRLRLVFDIPVDWRDELVVGVRRGFRSVVVAELREVV